MHLGVTIHATDRSMSPVDLAREAASPVGERARRVVHLGAFPLLVFTAARQPDPGYAEVMQALGIDPERMRREWPILQAELSQLSSLGKHFTLDATHTSIVTEEQLSLPTGMIQLFSRA